MAQDRTQPNKQIDEEKKSISKWKMKAVHRREENEVLKERLENVEGKIDKLEGCLKQAIDKSIVDDLKRQLEIANKIIAHQQEEILELKKKA
jgi:tetrahydromethanopterin S-methyltransferase subunit G